MSEDRYVIDPRGKRIAVVDGTPRGDPHWGAVKKTSKKAKGERLVGAPMAWLKQALPHVKGEHQIVVALLVYRRWIVCGKHRVFDFPNSDLKELGINRTTKRKALAGLVRAGLIAIEYLPGCAVRVTRRWR